MAKILILGGYGMTGKSLARCLLQQSDAHLVLAGRSLEKAQAYTEELRAEFASERVSALRLDAASETDLRAALPGVDLLLVASPTTRQTGMVARAALEAGADYLDVQLGAQKFALLESLAPEIERAGRCFITEAGFHPGLPSALVRYAAAQLDQIESAVTAGYLNMGKGLPYTEAVNELIETFKDYQAQVYRGGAWTRPRSFELRKIDFGKDIGRKQCYSMFFEELRPLPAMYPSLKEVGFYISESHWMIDWVIMPLTFAWLKLMPNALRPIGRFLWWGMGAFHKPPYRVELQVQATGIKDGKPACFKASVSHPDGYALTAIPVAATLLQYLDGSARKPGLWMMGHIPDPARLFEDMKRMGVEFSTTIK